MTSGAGAGRGVHLVPGAGSAIRDEVVPPPRGERALLAARPARLARVPDRRCATWASASSTPKRPLGRSRDRARPARARTVATRSATSAPSSASPTSSASRPSVRPRPAHQRRAHLLRHPRARRLGPELPAGPLPAQQPGDAADAPPSPSRSRATPARRSTTRRRATSISSAPRSAPCSTPRAPSSSSRSTTRARSTSATAPTTRTTTRTRSRSTAPSSGRSTGRWSSSWPSTMGDPRGPRGLRPGDAQRVPQSPDRHDGGDEERRFATLVAARPASTRRRPRTSRGTWTGRSSTSTCWRRRSSASRPGALGRGHRRAAHHPQPPPPGQGATPLAPPASPARSDLVGLDYYQVATPESRTIIARRTTELAVRTEGLGLPAFACELGAGFPPFFPPISERDSAFVALAALAYGLRGFNVYMAVERDRWIGAPIDPHGRPRPFAAFWRKLSAALTRTSFFTLTRRAPVRILTPRTERRLARVMHAFGPITGAFFSVAGKGARESVSEEDLGLGYPLGIASDSFARTFEAALEARGVPFACIGGEDRDVSLDGAQWIVCPTSGGLQPRPSSAAWQRRRPRGVARHHRPAQARSSTAPTAPLAGAARPRAPPPASTAPACPSSSRTTPPPPTPPSPTPSPTSACPPGPATPTASSPPSTRTGPAAPASSSSSTPARATWSPTSHRAAIRAVPRRRPARRRRVRDRARRPRGADDAPHRAHAGSIRTARVSKRTPSA